MTKSRKQQQLDARRRAQRQQERQQTRRLRNRRIIVIGFASALILAVGSSFLLGTSSTTSTPTTASTTPTTTPVTTTTRSPADTAAQLKADNLAVKAGCPNNPYTRVNKLTWTKAPAMSINPTQALYAHVISTQGTFVIKLLTAKAPITVNNFVFLARHDFYKCVIFHRVIPGFVIQGGDPTGTGQGGPGYTIADELPKIASPTYPLYSVAMANTGTPNTGGSQFFIVTGTQGETLANTYSLFGQVISGFAAVRTINAQGTPAGIPPAVVNRMLSVTITTTP